MFESVFRPTLGRVGRRAVRSGGVLGNERLTNSVALILLVLLPIEAATTIALGAFLPVHVALGLALLPLLALKLASVGWRLVRYYTHNHAYRRKGPPVLLLRLLAPVLVLSTIALFGSGVVLVLSGGRGGIVLTVHVTSFAIWGVAVLAHILWYGLRAIRDATKDWRGGERLAGAGARRALIIAAVLLGIATSIVLYSGREGGARHHDDRALGARISSAA
jgi:hypothetical protein